MGKRKCVEAKGTKSGLKSGLYSMAMTLVSVGYMLISTDFHKFKTEKMNLSDDDGCPPIERLPTISVSLRVECSNVALCHAVVS
jgi:hypothetical protein